MDFTLDIYHGWIWIMLWTTMSGSSKPRDGPKKTIWAFIFGIQAQPKAQTTLFAESFYATALAMGQPRPTSGLNRNDVINDFCTNEAKISTGNPVPWPLVLSHLLPRVLCCFRHPYHQLHSAVLLSFPHVAYPFLSPF